MSLKGRREQRRETRCEKGGFFLQNTGVYYVYTRLKQGESSAEKLYIAFAHLYSDLY